MPVPGIEPGSEAPQAPVLIHYTTRASIYGNNSDLNTN